MKIDAKKIETAIVNLLISEGVTKYDSEKTAHSMILADLYGVTTHGIALLPAHMDRLRRNAYNKLPQYEIVKESPSFAVIDADNALGFASASYCMEYAVKKATENGIFTVFSRHANTYGAAFCYPMIAADNGCIGFTICNSPAAMAATNGKTKILGTNPLAAVIPTSGNPIIIDMATSKVAKSKFLKAKKEGKQLQEGWALDKDGNPTIEPDEAIQGLVLPMEGNKGYALALLIDIIAGFLSGSGYLDCVGKFYSEDGSAMNVGQYFVAIEPKIVFGYDFNMKITEYVQRVRDSELIAGSDRIIVPGDHKYGIYLDNMKNGITISEEICNLLKLPYSCKN